MQDGFTKNENGKCVVCGAIVPRRDSRDKSTLFCGRVHAALARFSTRYRGSNSGPLDRPTTQGLFEKTKWQG